jgi:hypothetical protein
MWKYLPTLAAAFLASLQLAKDWGAHQTTWRRAGVLFLIMFLGIGGAVNTYYSEKNAALRHVADEKQIGELQKAVETANTAQTNNTKEFVQSFGDLSRQLNALQTQVNAAGLQKEASRLREQLSKQGTSVEAIRQSETLTGAKIELIAKEVAEIRNGNPSAKALLKVTGDLTGNLRQFFYRWQDSVHTVDLNRDELFRYRQPPLSQKEEIDAANKFLADLLDKANSTQKKELSSLLQDAGMLCVSLLGRISEEKQTAEDRKKRQEIAQLGQDMWAWEAYGCCPSALSSLADYLDALTKRVVSGEA